MNKLIKVITDHLATYDKLIFTTLMFELEHDLLVVTLKFKSKYITIGLKEFDSEQYIIDKLKMTIAELNKETSRKYL